MSESTDENTGTSSTPHDSFVPKGDPIDLAVIDAVAAVSGRPPLWNGSTMEKAGTNPLDPLYESIDPDALDTICQPKKQDKQSVTIVTFTYCGYSVTVDSTGQISITEQ